MKYTEAKLEETFIELLEKEGYPHTLGININRNPDDVLIKEDFEKYLFNKYRNESISK